MEAIEDNPDVLAPKRGKVGARIYDMFGNEEKRRRAIDLGLSEIVLPPITRKTVAKYRTIGQDKINPSTGQIADPQDVLIPGTYMFYDRGAADLTKRNVLMKNLGRPQIAKNAITQRQEIDEDQIEFVEFVNGIKSVNVEANYRLYVFLELHPMNGSNRFRPTSVAPVFERVDLTMNRDISFAIAEQDLGFEAEKTVMEMTKKDDIIAYATSMGVPTTEQNNPREIALIKHDLRTTARKNPKLFFNLGKNFKAAVRFTVIDAISWGLLEYVPDKKSYYFPMSRESLKPVHTVSVSEDPMESLIGFLSQEKNPDAADIYEAVYNMVNYWKMPGEP